MDTAVALVQAYLQLNGYLTVTEFPILVGSGRGSEVLTDVDLIALRFPRAATLGLTVNVLGTAMEEPTDPALAIAEDAMDLLLCEVKEGKGRINPNLRREDVLRAALLRVSCCPPEHVAHHVQSLLRRGEARMEHPGAVACRARLAVVAGRGARPEGAGLLLDLAHVARYTSECLGRRRAALQAAHLSHPVLGLLQLLDKVGLQVASR